MLHFPSQSFFPRRRNINEQERESFFFSFPFSWTQQWFDLHVGWWRKTTRNSTSIVNGSIISAWTPEKSGAQIRWNSSVACRSFSLGQFHPKYLSPVLFIDCSCSPGNNADARRRQVNNPSEIVLSKTQMTFFFFCALFCRSNLQRWQELADEHEFSQTNHASSTNTTTTELSDSPPTASSWYPRRKLFLFFCLCFILFFC